MRNTDERGSSSECSHEQMYEILTKELPRLWKQLELCHLGIVLFCNQLYYFMLGIYNYFNSPVVRRLN